MWSNEGVEISGAPVALQLLVVAGLVALNGFFVASEFAIVKVRSSQLEALEASGEKNARKAIQVTENLDAYLSATQLGITLASLALGWVGEPFIAHLLDPILLRTGLESETVRRTLTVGMSFAVITVMHIVLGELVPKTLAITKPVPTTLWVSGPLAFFYQVFRPAIWCLNGTARWFIQRLLRVQPLGEHELAHSEEELRVILTESEGARQVTPIGKEILMNALDLRKRVVRDITTPRKEVVFLNTEDSFEENLQRAIKSRHTRFPICEGHLDHAIGVIHIKDLLSQMRAPKPDLMRVRRDLLPVPEMMPLERLLSFFLAKHAHIALVVDEFGGTVGVVTLDNVLAELVGDIQDEFDTEEKVFKRLNANEFVVDGGLALYELKDLADLELESEDVSTVGGYVTHLTGHLPAGGERVRIGPWEATVLKSDGRRVLEVRFRRVPEKALEKQEK
ncbi:MAG: Magnesium and cobalt efflux protein CorC [Verrucomicrobiota bacterium]|jgi:CBS domain containing-hemolysin-like protein